LARRVAEGGAITIYVGRTIRSNGKECTMSTHSRSFNPSRRSIGVATALAMACVWATPSVAQQSTSLETCPARLPPLRIAMVSGGESYSSHPAETRFSSTHFTRLHQMPLIGADPKEERIDANYGIAESWSFLPGAKGMVVKLREGLTFNNGAPITPEDVVFRWSWPKLSSPIRKFPARSPASA
jgi:peptide/nickel transport system substrate-binding protein